jgi:hypothetical protein
MRGPRETVECRQLDTVGQNFAVPHTRFSFRYTAGISDAVNQEMFGESNAIALRIGACEQMAPRLLVER